MPLSMVIPSSHLFDKAVTNLVVQASNIEAQGNIPLAGKLLVDKIRDVITADNQNIGRKRRFQKAKETVIGATAASKGINWDDMTPESQNLWYMGFE